MIWSLTREQFRSQRRFVVSTGVVLALAITAAAYGLFMATTTSAAEDKADAAFGNDKDWHVTNVVAVTGAPEEAFDPDAPLSLPLAEQDAALAEAVADGSDVIAVRDFNVYVSDEAQERLVALGGTVDWDTILAQGEPPQPGEVALSGTLADAEGVTIGDPWTASVALCDDVRCTNVTSEFRVSGIARSGFAEAGIAFYLPDAYVAWDDSARVLDIITPSDWSYSAPPFTDFNWTVGSTALDSLGEPSSYSSSVGHRDVTPVSFAVLGALVLGLIAMAFAVGRAQAQARSKWVATARTLGANTRQIVATNLLEAGIVGLAAGGIGIALGFVAANMHIAAIHNVVPTAAYPSQVVAPAWALGALLLLALVLSAIVGAVPAFWAARVSPVAALKPVSDLSEAEVSRRVSVRPLVLSWVVANAAAIPAVLIGAGDLWVLLAILAGIVIVVTTPMLMHEALRWAIPWIGNRLARSPRRAAMVAGDSLLARPRQATIPGFIVALGVGTVVAIVVSATAQESRQAFGWTDYDVIVPWFASITLPSWVWYVATASVAITTVLTLAIGSATAALTAREAATREALGASRRDSRMAGAIAYLVTQASGIALGLGVGLYATAWLVPSMLPFHKEDLTAMDYVALSTAAFVPVLGVIVLATVGAAIGAAITARFTPQPTTAAMLESVA